MLAVVVVVVSVAGATAWYFASRAPAVTLALLGAIAAGSAAFVVRGDNLLHGFVIGDEGRRAGVPAEVALTASAVLSALAVTGALIIPPVLPRPWLQDAALALAAATPVAAAVFALLLTTACPPYVHGRAAGYCSYGSVDVLGGWASGVVALFVIDGFALAASLGISAMRVRSRWDATPS